MKDESFSNGGLSILGGRIGVILVVQKYCLFFKEESFVFSSVLDFLPSLYYRCW